MTAANQTDVYNQMLKNLSDTSVSTTAVVKIHGTELKNTGAAAQDIKDKIAALNLTISDDEEKITKASTAHKGEQ